MPRNRVPAKLTEKIRSCYEQQFTGFLKITEHTGKPWYVYLLLGRIVWAQSSKHPLRRWKRHLHVHSPVLSEQINEPVSLYYEYWHYAALARLVKLKQFPREQFSKVVEGCIAEVLFDILQAGIWQFNTAGELLIEEQSREAANMPFIMLENLQPWKKAQHDWHRWDQAGLIKVSPNWAPTIKRSKELKSQTPLQTFQTLSSFANGENTLRDLAIRFKQPIIPIAKSIRPYVDRKLLEFIEISDIVDSAHHGFHPELLDVHQTPSSTDSDSNSEVATDSQVQLEPPVSDLLIDELHNQELTDQEQTISKKTTTRVAEGAVDTGSATDTLRIDKTEVKEITDQELQGRELSAETTGEESVGKASASRETSDKEAASKERVNQEPTDQEVASKEAASKETARKERAVTKTPTKEPLATDQSSELQDSMVYQKPLRQTQVIEQPTAKTVEKPTEELAEETTEKSVEKKSQTAEHLQSKTNNNRVDKSKEKKKARKNLPKVIYIDDSPADSRAMGSIVEKLGYQYTNIPDPLQALPMLLELKPRLIFLDLVMPIANGYEVCAQIRRITAFKKTPVIIVTSNDGIADRVRAKIVGASGFMGKPIQEKKILKVFKKHLPIETSRQGIT
ncbi:MAG: response regulator [Cyanobacteria bacterium P01_D01_bin.1]